MSWESNLAQLRPLRGPVWAGTIDTIGRLLRGLHAGPEWKPAFGRCSRLLRERFPGGPEEARQFLARWVDTLGPWSYATDAEEVASRFLPEADGWST